MSFARKFGDKYGKKLMNAAVNTKNMYRKKIMDTTKKKRINFAKTADKKIVQKSAEATGDLIGNKIADKITSLGKSKNKEKENETNEAEEIIIPPEKRQKTIDDLRLF